MTPPSSEYPGGKAFAFTIIDDTDVATVANVKPVYRLLEQLGMRATKTVWPMACPEGSRNFGISQTLEDPEYLDFVRDLQARGFEIALHGATMESSIRERTVAGLERFRTVFGVPPRVHANHSFNRDNLYWGQDRLDDRLLRTLYRAMVRTRQDYYQGHTEGSAYFWGDLCHREITYVRNLTFTDINTRSANPSMPYHDPRRPWVKWWFSATDAPDGAAFVNLLRPSQQDKLERERGFCIVATHFGKRFHEAGRFQTLLKERLTELTARPGWFPTVGGLLDWLRAQRAQAELPPGEWQRMQRVWFRDLALRYLQGKFARM